MKLKKNAKIPGKLWLEEEIIIIIIIIIIKRGRQCKLRESDLHPISPMT